MIKTETIYNELKKSVFGQDEYLRQLAITGYKHQLKQTLIQKGKVPINSNLLVVGPSGCGKTFAVKKLSKLLDIPFYEVDCSNIVQTGYKGPEDITIALGNMVNTMGVINAEHAIVYLDEFDKILDLEMIVAGKGKGSQQNFLKVLEPNKITVTYKDSLKQNKTCLDTSGITFIATGSFEVAKERIGKTSINLMGFNVDKKRKNGVELDDEDLIKSGYMPELIGRFASIININQLGEEDFYNIVKHSDSSDMEKYKTVFEEQDIELNIDDEVYKEIARKSFNTVTGARNIGKILNTVLDKCLSDVSNDETIRSIDVKFIDNSFKADYKHDQKKVRINRLINLIGAGAAVKKEEYIDAVEEMIYEFNVEIRMEKDLIEYFRNLFGNRKEMKKSELCNLLEGDRKKTIDRVLSGDEDFKIIEYKEMKYKTKIYNFLINKYSDKNNVLEGGH